MRFVRFQWTRNHKPISLISIHLVHKLLALNCSNEQSPSFRVSGQELAGHNPSTASFAEGFLHDFDELALLFVPLDNNHSPGIRANNQKVPLHAHQTEC